MQPPEPPTRDEYDAAKRRQLADPEAHRSQNPSAEVLADVDAIRRFEAAENRRAEGGGGR